MILSWGVPPKSRPLLCQTESGAVHPAPTRLHPHEANDARIPVYVLGLQMGQVRLRSAQVPGKLIERLSLGIPLALYNLAMLVRRDGALFLEADNGPLALGHQRPRQPVHIDAEIVQTPEIDVRGDRAGLKYFEHELGRSLGDDQGQQRHVGLVFRRALPARAVRGALQRGQRGQGIRPRALGDAVVRSRQIRFGEFWRVGDSGRAAARPDSWR